MAGLAVPLLEGAAARVLVGLGVGAAGAGAVDSVRKRQKEAEKATSMPIARVDVCSEDNSKCKDCPPDKGVPFPRNERVVARIDRLPKADSANAAGSDRFPDRVGVPQRKV